MSGILNVLLGDNAPAVAGGNSAAYDNFIARTSGLDSTHLTAYAGLLNGLTTDGFFDGSGNSSLLDALYVWATATSTIGLLNICANNGGTVITGAGGVPAAFAADQGYTGNITNGGTAIDTGLDPAATTNFVQNSAHLSVWKLTAGSLGPTQRHGWSDGSTETIVSDDFGAGFASGTVNAASISLAAGTATNTGFYLVNRTASNAQQLYLDGSSANTQTTASATIPSGLTFYFLAANLSSSISQAGNEQIAAGSFGASLDATQVSNLHSRLLTYLQAVGAV